MPSTSKRQCLGKVSFLGMIKDMRYLNVSKLLGREHLTMEVLLLWNGFAYQVQALIDSGANGYALIQDTLLSKLSSFLKPCIYKLPTIIRVNGYNGQPGTPITHYCHLNLSIDGRVQSYTPFLITSLGAYGIMLGRKWLKEHRVLLDAANQRLHWPDDMPSTPSYAQNLILTDRQLSARQISKRHQQDMARRDRKFEAMWKRRDGSINALASKTIPAITIAIIIATSTPTPAFHS